MLKEALEYLTRLGRETVPDVIKAEAEPGHVYYLRDKDGNLTRTVAAIAPARHAADDLDTVVALALADPQRSKVWVRPNTVVVTFGDQARDMATLHLPFSTPLSRLILWAKEKPALSQAAFIAELRTTFHGCLAAHPDLVAILRKVRFNLNQQTVGEVGHGRASLGKTIEGQVYGTADIPELVVLNMPVYANPRLMHVRTQLQCVLDPDPATGNFRLIPLPGEIEQAVEAGTARVALDIKDGLDRDAEGKDADDHGVEVLFGSP